MTAFSTNSSAMSGTKRKVVKTYEKPESEKNGCRNVNTCLAWGSAFRHSSGERMGWQARPESLKKVRVASLAQFGKAHICRRKRRQRRRQLAGARAHLQRAA